MISQIFENAINIATAHKPYSDLLTMLSEGFPEMQASLQTLQDKCCVPAANRVTLTHTADPSETNGKITLHKSNKPYVDIRYSYDPKYDDFYINASNIRYDNKEYLNHDQTRVKDADVGEAAERIAIMVADLAKRFGHPGIRGTLEAALKAQRDAERALEIK